MADCRERYPRGRRRPGRQLRGDRAYGGRERRQLRRTAVWHLARGPYIIGVHSGDEYKYIPTPFGDIVAENNNVAAGGSGMVNMIRKALADWP